MVHEVVARLLREELANEQIKRSGYSLRRFSRKLNLSSGTLSAIMNGKRKISSKMAIRIVDQLFLDSERRDLALKQLAGECAPDAEYSELDSASYQVISDWYHFAILSLIKTRGFQSDPAYVAERLGISVSQARGAVETLFKLSLLRETLDGKWVRTRKRLRTSDGIRSAALRRAHHQNLELAQRSLVADPIEKRDISALTMAIDPQKLPEAVALIRDFQNRLSELLESGHSREVYKLCTALFPLSK